MANDIERSPFLIDTAAVVTEEKVFVKQMVWQEPTAAAEDLVVKDGSGRILWDENAYTGGTGISIEQDINQFCDGIEVTTIDSGTLYIYCERR